MVQYENKRLEILDLRYECTCVCICALMRDGEREHEIDLIGYVCQNSAVRRLTDFSFHSSEFGSSSRRSTLLPHAALNTRTASWLFPAQQELGIPYASNDLIFALTSHSCVLLKSQTNHLI